MPSGPVANMQLLSSEDEEASTKNYPLIFLRLKLTTKASSNRQHYHQVPVKDNIYWKELTVLLSVWVAFLAVQVIKVRFILFQRFKLKKRRG